MNVIHCAEVVLLQIFFLSHFDEFKPLVCKKGGGV